MSWSKYQLARKLGLKSSSECNVLVSALIDVQPVSVDALYVTYEQQVRIGAM